MSRSFGAAEAAFAIAALLLAAAPAVAAEPGVTVGDAWLRFVIASRPAAGYFTLTNDGDRAVSLVRVSSPGCGAAMLHRSVRENGQDRMVPVDRVEVPAHGSIGFAPGGYHVMCMMPTGAVRPGASVPVTLGFADGGEITADFVVRRIGR